MFSTFNGGCQYSPPQIGPGGIAVNSQNRAGGLDAAGSQCRSSVQDMEGAFTVIGLSAHQMRPRRIDAGKRGVAEGIEGQPRCSGRYRLPRAEGAESYHSSSTIAVLRPEPTPIQSTRAPRARLAASRASVIGSEAGPTLPSSG